MANIHMGDLERGDKDIYQWIDDAAKRNMPRQATVVRPDGKNVWVRFVGEDGSAPETVMPSVIANLPAGTVGWVYPIADSKGMFLPWGAMVAFEEE